MKNEKIYVHKKHEMMNIGAKIAGLSPIAYTQTIISQKNTYSGGTFDYIRAVLGFQFSMPYKEIVLSMDTRTW